jgi:hypothetical protein
MPSPHTFSSQESALPIENAVVAAAVKSFPSFNKIIDPDKDAPVGIIRGYIGNNGIPKDFLICLF